MAASGRTPQWRPRVPIDVQDRLARVMAGARHLEPGLTWAKLLRRWARNQNRIIRRAIRAKGDNPDLIAPPPKPLPGEVDIPEFGKRVNRNRGSVKGKPRKD